MDYLETITGEIEALGQSEISKGGYSYAYIRFVDDAGNVVMKKDVGVGNTVNSYLSPGLKGNFHFSKLTESRSLMFAFDNESRKVYDQSEMKEANALAKNTVVLFIGMIIVSLVIVIGVFWVVFLIKPIFVNYKIALRTKPAPIEQYLSKYGYKV